MIEVERKREKNGHERRVTVGTLFIHLYIYNVYTYIYYYYYYACTNVFYSFKMLCIGNSH